jgi:hypothetical protein
MKLYTEEQVLKIIQKTVMDKPETYYEVLQHYTPIELPSDEEIEKIAQWVIDNRYAKSELNKVSDFEMYHHIIKWMKEQILQPNL